MVKHLLISALLLLSTAAPGLSQTARGNPVSRTPWGDPDLQGVWDYWTFTPLERPKEYANKPTLSDAEYADLIKRLSGQAASADAGGRQPATLVPTVRKSGQIARVAPPSSRPRSSSTHRTARFRR